MIKPIAIFVTSTAVTMTAIAAWDRGGTFADKAVLVAMSVVIVVAVHLLPAMSRRPVTWLVWMGCLVGAIYGHLTFFTNSAQRAADNRAQQSALAVGTQRQIDTAKDALSRIAARPIATVTAELALSEDRRERAALRAEIAEGKRAQVLLDDLARLSAVVTVANIPVTDPVTARLAAVTGWNESQVAVAIGLTFSILLELIGALLWYEAMRRTTVIAPLSNGTTCVTRPVTDIVTMLRGAVTAGECQKTVRGIREFLGCSQERAMELRRGLQ
jgi:hypothetical protein